MDRKNITIVSLASSAVILLALLVFLQMFNSPNVVVAGSMEARGGDYIATMGKIASDAEALFLLDSRSRNIGIYYYDNNSKRIELYNIVPLSQIERTPSEGKLR
jgi:hypothetical protein